MKLHLNINLSVDVPIQKKASSFLAYIPLYNYYNLIILNRPVFKILSE